MYEQHLTQSGLTKEQAIVYEVLLKSGVLPAGKISSKTAELNEKIPIKRGLVYKILEQLVDFGLITKQEEPGKVAMFQVTHPLKIKELVEKKERQAKDAELALDGVLGSLVSDFNLISGKPGISIYEGLDGLEKILYDSLNAKSTICQYIDNESVVKNFYEIDKEYTKKRKLKGVRKKMLIVDCEYVRSHADDYDREISDVRIINKDKISFNSTMLIYDNKVSYLTTNKKIGLLIDDADIAGMHKILFEYAWDKSEPLLKTKEA